MARQKFMKVKILVMIKYEIMHSNLQEKRH